METEELRKELKEIKECSLLSAKTALTMSDASLITGLSKSHLYKLVCAKSIPYYKSPGGKLTFFEKSELTAWMLSHRVPTQTEIAEKAATYCAVNK